MASPGPVTLAHMKLIKEITADTVKMSQVPAEIAIPMPEIKLPTSAPDIPGIAPTATASAAKPDFKTASAGGPSVRSIWDTIKGVFKS